MNIQKKRQGQGEHNKKKPPTLRQLIAGERKKEDHFFLAHACVWHTTSCIVHIVYTYIHTTTTRTDADKEKAF